MRIRTLAALFAAVSLLCVTVSCGKKAPPETIETVPPLPLAHGAPVAVLFAYGYSDADFLAETKAIIRERFSREDELVNDDAIMAPLIFPDDFPNERISLLYDKIYNRPDGGALSAFVLLGAPERTHAALARLRDTWDAQGGTIPVVSLFSQDDVLGTEAESDVTVDFVPLPETPAVADRTDETAAARRISPDTLVQILTELHRRVVAEPPLPVSPEKGTVEALFGSDYLVSSYRDAETGLIAASHFLVDFRGEP